MKASKITKPKGFLTRLIASLLGLSIFLTSCSSTTVIQSSPSPARLYLNGEPVGETPYTHTDTRIVGSTTTVRLEKEGYETLHTFFSRDEEADVGAIVGGIFLLFPFLWLMKYKPSHFYELTPLREALEQPQPVGEKQATEAKSKAERLRELRQLLDADLITKEEYQKHRAEILRDK